MFLYLQMFDQVKAAYEKAAQARTELVEQHGPCITFPKPYYGKAEPDKE